MAEVGQQLLANISFCLHVFPFFFFTMVLSCELLCWCRLCQEFSVPRYPVFCSPDKKRKRPLHGCGLCRRRGRDFTATSVTKSGAVVCGAHFKLTQYLPFMCIIYKLFLKTSIYPPYFLDTVICPSERLPQPMSQLWLQEFKINSRSTHF